MFRALFKLILFLCFLAPFIWGYMTWQNFLTSAEVLKDKDAQEYELMTKKFSSFSFKEGFKIYEHLQNTSKAEFIEMRFHEYRKKWYQDKTFRKEQQTQEVSERKELKNERNLEYQSNFEELQAPEEKYQKKALFIRWETAPSWQKALLLREKCYKYLSLEKQSSGRRENTRNLPTIVALLGGPGKKQLPVAELCEEMIPAGADDKEIESALQTLREQINYYFFVDLLREAGIPRDAIFSQDNRLKRMATDFINN